MSWPRVWEYTVTCCWPTGLMKPTFGNRFCRPVIIPRGYTKKYIEKKVSYEQQIRDIENSFGEVAKASDVVLIEGTGHCAVGSIVNVNNAKVASILGASMLLIANGGLGK